MLHGWIRNQLPVIPGQKRDGEPSLAVALKDIWRGDYRHVQLGDYFEGEIHDMWSQKSPNDKLLALMDVLSLTFPSDVVEVYEKALKTRNEFVHPKDGNWPSKSKKPKRTGRLSPEFSLQWYDKVTETFTTIAETLSLRTRKACSRYIATNFRNLREYLSEKQRVAFGTFMKNSSDTYKTLELFVQALDDYKTKEMTLPEVVVLGTTQEVADKVPLLRKVARKHKDIPIILYGWPWSEGAGREGLKALETLALGNAQVTYIPEHIYPKGKYDATYKPEKVLQKKIKELTNT